MRTNIHVDSDCRLPIQRLDVYQVAKAFVLAVHQAHIRDPELRGQASRASKSALLNTCEGLPNHSVAMRRKYFTTARGSVSEAVGAVDAADCLGATTAPHRAAVQRLGVRLHQLLSALLR